MGSAASVSTAGLSEEARKAIDALPEDAKKAINVNQVKLEGAPAAGGLVGNILGELDGLTMEDVRQIVSAPQSGGPGLPEASLKIVLDAIRAHKSLKPGKKMFDIDVASVPELPSDPAERAAFKEKWVSDAKGTYVTELDGEIFVNERKQSDAAEIQIQFNRFEWVTKTRENAETYVNMLRVCGHSDSNIQAMFDGKRPLNFTDPAVHVRFCKSLRDLGAALEKEMGWANVRFMQQGSSVAGYSSNPLKGFRDTPSKITDPESSDVDVCILGDGVAEWARKQSGGKWRSFPPSIPFDRAGYRPVYEADDFKKICAPLTAWLDEWDGKEIKGGVQLLFLEHPSPFLNPWTQVINTSIEE